MKLTLEKIHIGRRTIKTVLSVVIAMLVVEAFGCHGGSPSDL